jgi:DNA repair protein RecO (recombination protein O)
VSRLDCEALVLRIVDFGESDRIAHLLTPATSRLTVIAKGARRSRRRFPGILDLFNHLSVQVERRRPQALARLEQARLVDSFPGLRTDAGRFALACYAVELVDRLAPEGASDGRRLFDATVGALRAIAARAPSLRLRVLLELRLLAALGLAPELRRCVRCGREVGGAAAGGPAASGGKAAQIGFHVAEGGPLCGGCALPGDALLPAHLGTLRALEQGLALPLDRLERLAFGAQTLHEAQALLARFQRFHAGVELRSEAFLERALATGGAAS